METLEIIFFIIIFLWLINISTSNRDEYDAHIEDRISELEEKLSDSDSNSDIDN